MTMVMQSIRKIVFAVLYLSLVNAFAVADKETAIRQDVLRDIKDEESLGREMAAKLLGHFGVYKLSPQSLEYINLVGQTLVRKVGRPETTYRFGVLRSNEINAYATPGGYVFVTNGLLEFIENESELATVLSHEIAHVNEKHMYLEIMPKREVSATETVVRMMSRGNSDLGKSLSQIIGKGLKMLLEGGLGKEKEQAADEAGLVYAASVGYNPTALLKFLKRLESRGEKVQINKAASPLPERIAAVEAAIQKNGLTDTMIADAKVLDTRFRDALAKVSKKAMK